MKYLIVIPARGGSKGIPHKNIVPIKGKPLLEYSIEVALGISHDCDIAVSTDDDEIAAVAAKYEKVTVVKRPDEISHDTASTEAALLHACEYMCDKMNTQYDAVVTLQPTSPLRTVETFEAFLNEFESNYPEYDALLTLSECRGDYWVENDGCFGRLYPNAPRRRQDRKPIYLENSCIYVTATEALQQTNSVLGNNVTGFVISETEGIDINVPEDLAIAEAFMK